MSEPQKIAIDGDLTMQVPVPVRASTEQAIDSAAVVLSGDGITILVDKGPLASDLSEYQQRHDHRSQECWIVGRPAHTISFTDSDGTSVAAVRIEPPPDDGEDAIPLTIVVRTDARLGRDAAVRAVETLAGD